MAVADILEFPRQSIELTLARGGSPGGPLLDPAQLRLANTLHRHLDLTELLKCFLIELQSAHPIEGIGYSPSDSAECFVAGRIGAGSLHSPLHLDGEHLGQIEVQPCGELRTSLATLLAPLAAPLRNALHHHRLKLLARRDPLTGLGNRAALDSALETELARAQRFGQPFSLLIADIDHFKRVNDTLGHGFGDQVIRTVAEHVQGCLRPYDQAFRYGGEEFVVLLSQTGLDKALQVAERIRRRVRQRGSVSATTGRITVSIGVGQIHDAEHMDTLFERTDRALYQAKRLGRDRCVAAAGPDQS